MLYNYNLTRAHIYTHVLHYCDVLIHIHLEYETAYMYMYKSPSEYHNTCTFVFAVLHILRSPRYVDTKSRKQFPARVGRVVTGPRHGPLIDLESTLYVLCHRNL